jgi:hypothetical protein
MFFIFPFCFTQWPLMQLYGGSQVSIVIGYKLDVQHSVPSINRDLAFRVHQELLLPEGTASSFLRE